MPASEFWELTPFEFILYVNAHIDRQKAEMNGKITIAYLTAKLQRADRMPALEELLGEQAEPVEKKPEDLLNMVKSWNAALGGEEAK